MGLQVLWVLWWNLGSLFLSRDGLIGGNCKDLVRHAWSVDDCGLYHWLVWVWASQTWFWVGDRVEL